MDLTHNIIEYVNCCVGAFANRFKLTLGQSYVYLRRFKAIDFLIDCYAAEHTLSIEDAVDDSLYYEGAVYVFSYLENEIETGVVC